MTSKEKRTEKEWKEKKRYEKKRKEKKRKEKKATSLNVPIFTGKCYCVTVNKIQQKIYYNINILT